VGTFTGTDQIDADVESWDNSADDFDDWCAERDARFDHSVSAQYVSDDVIGYEDLDEFGGWRPTPEYGTIWFPHVTVVGWAPYHYGHWAYVAPWGYTWVDDAPWGFAPFHYGRWVVVGGVWGWVPAPPRPVVVGAVYVRPVYAPALVAWVGGPGFAAGFSVGGGFAAGVNVGWFPLGPREVYVPSYPVSRTYWTNVNISNTRVETTVVNNYYTTVVVNKTVVNNIAYVNQRVPGAVVATSPAVFTSAQPVSRNFVKVDARVVVSAPVVAAAPAVVPTRQAVLGAGAVARVRPPAAIQARAIVAKTAPPPPPPAFDKQQEAIKANAGRPIAVAQMRQIQPPAAQAHAAVRIAPKATPQAVTARGPQPNPNHPNAVPNNANRPALANTNNRPAENANNRPANTNANLNPKNNAPVNSHPATETNPQLEQQHAQQLQNLRSQQDQERQKLEQQQAQERNNLAQKNAGENEQQKLNQQHQQQLQNLEQKHDTQEQNLKQKQEQEHKQQQKPANNKPPKDEKKPNK
jgi:hypothetical protein